MQPPPQRFQPPPQQQHQQQQQQPGRPAPQQGAPPEQGMQTGQKRPLEREAPPPAKKQITAVDLLVPEEEWLKDHDVRGRAGSVLRECEEVVLGMGCRGREVVIVCHSCAAGVCGRVRAYRE